MITSVLKRYSRNDEHSITDMYEAKPKCVCLPFSELILSLPNKKIMLFHWLKKNASIAR